jgi:hypothetical protein
MNFTRGQRHALLILAKDGARIGSSTHGGVGWENRAVHLDVAYLLIERGLATIEGERVTLTEAGKQAAEQTHPEWYRHYVQNDQ